MADFEFNSFPIPAKVVDDPDDKVDKTTTVNGKALSSNVVLDAGDIEFSRTQSGLLSSDVQGAIDELAAGKADKSITVNGKPISADVVIDSDEIAYDNTSSGLSATDIQGAIDELESQKANSDITVNNQPLSSNITLSASDIGYDNSESQKPADTVQEAIDEAFSELGTGYVTTGRTINGETLDTDVVLKSENFSEEITGEKMLANLTYTNVATW